MSDSTQVALCVTCLVDQIMPEVGVATVKLLRRAGYDVAFPEDQTCCGQPFFNSGFKEKTINLAKRTIEIFESQEIVVLPSGSCTTMIRKEYPHLFADDPEWHARAIALADKTFELTEFLGKEGKLPENTGEIDTAVTYHDSCHMCRNLGLKNEPREALTTAGYDIHEMKESDRCCGFGGLFSIRMPEVSNAMTQEKVDQALDTMADVLVTADGGCLMQMRGLAEGIDIKHIAVMLEEATR